MSDLRWHIILSYAQAEWKAYNSMLGRGIETYFPWTVASVRRNRWEQGTIRALFPGYLFAGIKPPGQSTDDIRQSLGVRDILRVGVDLVVISAVEMQAIRTRCTELYGNSFPRRNDIASWHVGDVIPVPYGPYIGTPVMIDAIDNHGRIDASMGNLRVTFQLGVAESALQFATQ